MKSPVDPIAYTVFLMVTVCWVFFGVVFLLGRKGAARGETKRVRTARAGFVLELLAYAVVWSFRRPHSTPIAAMPKSFEIVLAIITVAMGAASILFCLAAVRTLGKQWALDARVIEGHELVTLGPYSVVRNPIYLGMFGLLVATGLAISHWEALVAAGVLFLAGNEVRIRSEEKLLREAFGAQFEEYARRVPAFFPRLF